MNQSNTAFKPLENNLASQNLDEKTRPRVRVEPWEFELLLQRAMEILNVRARIATASHS